MRKYKDMLNMFIERVREKNGHVEDSLRQCAGRAQLLAHIKKHFFDYFHSKALDTELLMSMFGKEELERQLIFTDGIVKVMDSRMTAIVLRDCHIVAWNAQLYAFDKATVDASGTSQVFGYGQSEIIVSARAKVSARDRCKVTAFDLASVKAYDNATVNAQDATRVNALGHTDLNISGDCTARVMGTVASVKAAGFATVHHDGLESLELEDYAVAVDVNNKTVRHGPKLKYGQTK